MPLKRCKSQPTLITSFLIFSCALLPWSCAADESLISSQSLAVEVDRLMQPLVQDDLISGTILIAVKGEILFCKGYGSADREHDIANSCESVFRIGSLTKPFTALAVMQLHRNGLLHIDSALSAYLPDYPNGERITIRQLLSHTSGIKSFVYLPDYVERSVRPHSVSEVIEWFQSEPLLFEPGESFHYSNSGYVVLTALIEKVSNQSYGSYLSEHILKPSKMMHTGVDSSSLIIAGRADGYTRQAYGEIDKATYQYLPFGIGHGGMYSTAKDLCRWDRSLRTGELLDKELQRQMWTPVLGDYGLGWQISEEYDHRVLSHGGAISGYMAGLKRFLDIDLLIVSLFNFETLLEQEITRRLPAIALNESWSPIFAEPGDSVYAAACERFRGKYELEPGYYLSFFEKDGGLFIEETGYEPCPAYVIADVRVFSKEMNAMITYRAASGDRSARVEVLQGLLYWEAVKIR